MQADAASSAAAAVVACHGASFRSTRCLIGVCQARQLGWGERCVDLRVLPFHSCGCCTTAVALQYSCRCSAGAPSHGDRLQSSGGRVHVGNARVHAIAQRSARLALELAQPALEHVLTQRWLCGRLCTCSGPISTFPWCMTTIFDSPCADAPRTAWWSAKFGATRPLRRSRCTRLPTARTVCICAQ